MADTTQATGLTVQQWDDKFFVEYHQDSVFKPYMGSDDSAIIQVNEDLSKKRGDSITFALVNSLSGAGVTGTATLEGSEEALETRSFRLYVDKVRNGVRVAEMSEQRSAIDLRDAARGALKRWIMNKTRDDIITALGSINGTAYGSASEGNKDAWLVDNADRVLFGAAIGNNAANDHSAALLTLDTTNDKFTAAAARQMKRLALAANPAVTPIEVKGGKRVYVVFCGPRTFRDLQTSLETINRDAMQRGMDNPIISGADLHYDGMVFKLVDNIPIYAGVGASSADVSPVYLCGAQAIGVGYAKRTRSVTEVFDYADKNGVAIEEIRGIKKLIFGSGSGDTDDLKDNGVVTGYFAAPADA